MLFQYISTMSCKWFVVVLNPRNITTSGLGSSAFARHYLQNRFFFLLLWVLRCFSSPRLASIYYLIHIWISVFYYWQVSPFGYPWLVTDICSSPWLFAACHVLLRLLMPRHSPYALTSLTYFFQTFLRISWKYLIYIIYFSMCYEWPVIKNYNWWRWGESNSWPRACKARALPTKLHPQI